MDRRALRSSATTAKRRGLLAAMATAIVLSGARPLAHDLWIEPTTFSPAAGAIVGARLRVGQDMLGDPVPRDPALIREFVIDDAKGRRELVGHARSDPAGLLRVIEPGLMIIGYHSLPSRVELTAETFNTYLTEEGLDAVAAARARRGPTNAGVRELFSRCAKSLLLSGSPNPAHRDRALGFELELVAERNPYQMAQGDSLPVRLTYEGRPLAGSLVVAMNRLDPAAKVKARTDREGRVRLQLPRAGVWLVKAVHMIPAAPQSNADWESFWASLTFELPETRHATRASSR